MLLLCAFHLWELNNHIPWSSAVVLVGGLGYEYAWVLFNMLSIDIDSRLQHHTNSYYCWVLLVKLLWFNFWEGSFENRGVTSMKMYNGGSLIALQMNQSKQHSCLSFAPWSGGLFALLASLWSPPWILMWMLHWEILVKVCVRVQLDALIRCWLCSCGGEL